MTKESNSYICMECGFKATQWMGKCNNCESWNSFEKETYHNVKSKKISKIQKISEVQIQAKGGIKTKINTFDNLYGDKVPYSSITLLGGEPGVGKSTLLLNICKNLESSINSLYISGEESIDQLAQRANRLGAGKSNISLMHETSWTQIKEVIQKNLYGFIVLDSIQTLYNEFSSGFAGSVSQVKSIVFELLEIVKRTKSIVFIVGQINKEGAFAGPKVLEHMVDTSLFVSHSGHGYSTIDVTKNRYGDINKRVYFKLEEKNVLFLENQDIQSVTLDKTEVVGSVKSTLCFKDTYQYIEVQSLIRESISPMIKTYNLEQSRAQIIMAILEKHGEMFFSNMDVYINIDSNVSVKDKKIDTSIAAALMSSFFKKPLKQNIVFSGEFKLTGEIKVEKNDNLVRKILENKSIEILCINSSVDHYKIRRVQCLKSLKNEIFT